MQDRGVLKQDSYSLASSGLNTTLSAGCVCVEKNRRENITIFNSKFDPLRLGYNSTILKPSLIFHYNTKKVSYTYKKGNSCNGKLFQLAKITKYFIRILWVLPFISLLQYLLEYATIFANVPHTGPRKQLNIELQRGIGRNSWR